MSSENILDLWQEQTSLAAHRAMRALIIQPGAIGDCILTLPLAHYLKESLGIGSIDLLAHVSYVDFYPNRTAVDCVRSLETVPLHKLFVASDDFQLKDKDPLSRAFVDYEWIVSFLGASNRDFEANLTFTVYSSHSADVLTLPLAPPAGCQLHVADFYIETFLAKYERAEGRGAPVDRSAVLIRPSAADRDNGKQLLSQLGVSLSEPLLVMHPGSGGASKCWCVENYLAIAEQAARRGGSVLFLLGPAELERLDPSALQRIQATAPILQEHALTEVMCVLACAQAFLGNDSGISHMAGAMGLRTVVMFGGTNPEVYCPIGPDVRALCGEPQGFTRQASPKLQADVLAALCL
ncbi:MAG: glycosyltransferase family 9 protein [Planctomycetes bacterium]|nr:glycosyltransferase family 9 protein [Planctomycetota bacterium]